MPEQSSSSLTAPVARRDVDRFLDLLHSFGIPKCLQAVADFGIADALGAAPATAAELAAKTGVNADALNRMLRYLATEGVFEDADGRFRHTALSRLLRADHPQTQKGYARLIKPVWLAFEPMDHSLRTGRPATDTLAPGGLWEWLRVNPQLAAIFDQGMVSHAGADIAALLKAYDFSGFRSIADIGGGQGHLLRAVLEAVPGAEGTLFDQPGVIDSVRDRPANRMHLVAGNFFKDPLPRCDAYCLMSVIHDWDDEQSVSILQNVRRAAAPGGKLLLVEMLLQETLRPGYVTYMDVAMLVFTGGRERKRSEYERLLHAGGWRLERVVPTESFMSILEALPA